MFKNKKLKNLKLIDKQLTAKYCGHKTDRYGKIEAYGSSVKTEMPLRDGGVDYCLDCIGKMAIRCTWCGETIFIGDPITLYSTSTQGFQPPEYAIRYKDNQFVGCLGWDCAETGADRAGFWLPDTESNAGHVVTIRSMYSTAASDGLAISGD